MHSPHTVRQLVPHLRNRAYPSFPLTLAFYCVLSRQNSNHFAVFPSSRFNCAVSFSSFLLQPSSLPSQRHTLPRYNTIKKFAMISTAKTTASKVASVALRPQAQSRQIKGHSPNLYPICTSFDPWTSLNVSGKTPQPPHSKRNAKMSPVSFGAPTPLHHSNGARHELSYRITLLHTRPADFPLGDFKPRRRRDRTNTLSHTKTHSRQDPSCKNVDCQALVPNFRHCLSSGESAVCGSEVRDWERNRDGIGKPLDQGARNLDLCILRN